MYSVDRSVPAQSPIVRQPSSINDGASTSSSLNTTITISNVDVKRYCDNCKKYSINCVCAAISFGAGYGAASIKSSAWSSKCPSFDNHNVSTTTTTQFPW